MVFTAGALIFLVAILLNIFPDGVLSTIDGENLDFVVLVEWLAARCLLFPVVFLVIHIEINPIAKCILQPSK